MTNTIQCAHGDYHRIGCGPLRPHTFPLNYAYTPTGYPYNRTSGLPRPFGAYSNFRVLFWVPYLRCAVEIDGGQAKRRLQTNRRPHPPPFSIGLITALAFLLTSKANGAVALADGEP